MSQEKAILDDEDVTVTRQSVNLKQKITLVNGVCLIVGNIIGSGIFLTPKGVHEKCGSVALSMIIWVVSGVLSMVGAICYVELGTTIVKSGASYAYIVEAFGPLIGFVRLWVSVLIIEPTVQAAIAITFANYLVQPFFPTCEPPFLAVRLLAAACVCFIMIMNCYSVRYGTRIQDVFAYAKVAALIVIIIAGFIALFRDDLNSGSLDNPWEGTTNSVGNIALAMYSGLYSYSGWDTLNFMVEELKNPYRNLPLAIYISMPICTVIYMLANIAYYAVLTPGEIIATDAVAVGFAEKTLGVMAWIVPVSVAMSCFGGLNASMMASSRLFFVGARERQLPDYFAMVSVDRFTPAPSMILTGTLTVVFLCVRNVFDLINYYSFMYWLTVGLAIVGQIYLRFVRKKMERPLKFWIGWPFIFCFFCFFLVIVPFFTETKDSLIGTAMLMTGFPIYFLLVKPSTDKHPRFLRAFSQKATAFMQLLFPSALTEKELSE